jgi:hypothetical protein
MFGSNVTGHEKKLVPLVVSGTAFLHPGIKPRNESKLIVAFPSWARLFEQVFRRPASRAL